MPMVRPPNPPDEEERLQALHGLGLLDTPAEERFDRITRLARKVLGTRTALISLVDRDRQWFKSAQGLFATETPRDVSFCGHAVLDSKPLVVRDAREDPRFADNPLVTGEPRIRLYAGHPIRAPNGSRVGTLCVIDPEPRSMEEGELDALADLAAVVEDELRLDALTVTERQLHEQLSEAERRASVDGLTRLWNREAILKLLRLELERSGRAGRGVGVVFLDVDHFKSINDTLGHSAGDRVLAGVADRMRRVARPSDAIGRYGGEEFLVVVAEASLESAVGVGNRIGESIRRTPIELEPGNVRVTASLGVSFAKADGPVDAGQLVAAADSAMYRAKRAGRDRLEVA